MRELNKNPWATWIGIKYDEWRKGKIGNAASIAEFARQFNASHQVVLGWMEGAVPKSEKYIRSLVAVYGDEVYTVLGLPVPDSQLSVEEKAQRILSLIDQTPENEQDKLLGLIEELLELKGWRRIK